MLEHTMAAYLIPGAVFQDDQTMDDVSMQQWSNQGGVALSRTEKPTLEKQQACWS